MQYTIQCIEPALKDSKIRGSCDKLYGMIRQFQLQDAPSCCMIIHACIEGDASLSLVLRRKVCALETSQSMIERSRLYYVAVYEAEGRIAGIAGLDMNEIRLLCVLPEFQRSGIGRALLDHVKAMVPGLMFKNAFVYASIQAAGFYRACGFEDKGPFVFNVEGEAFHTAFMVCPIIG